MQVSGQSRRKTKPMPMYSKHRISTGNSVDSDSCFSRFFIKNPIRRKNCATMARFIMAKSSIRYCAAIRPRAQISREAREIRRTVFPYLLTKNQMISAMMQQGITRPFCRKEYPKALAAAQRSHERRLLPEQREP